MKHRVVSESVKLFYKTRPSESARPK